MRALLITCLLATTVVLAGCGTRIAAQCVDHPVICAGAVGGGAAAAAMLL